MEFYPEGMNAELDRQFTTPEALRRAILRHPNMKWVFCHVLAPQKGGEARM